MKRSTAPWIRNGIAALVSSVVLSGALDTSGWASAAPGAAAREATWLQGWPMIGHDPQRTNRSPGSGPAHPHLIFSSKLLRDSVVIDPDGNLYGWGQNGLASLNARGQARWTSTIMGIEGGPPALAPNALLLVNGMVLTGSGAGRRAGMAVQAIALATGMPRWAIHTLPWAPDVGGTFYANNQPIAMGRSVPLSKGVAPLVTPTSMLYMPFVGPSSPNAGVEVISPRGRPLRRLAPEVEAGAIALAADGTLYEMGYQGLVAFAPTGEQRWARPSATTVSSTGTVLVGARGTIYASDGAAVVAYMPSGRRLWRQETGAEVTALAERADGVLLVAGAAELLAVSPHGTRLWQRALGHPAATSSATASIAVDAAGRAYVGSADGKVRAIAPSGTLLWTLRAEGPTNPYLSPSVALGPRDTLVVAGTDGQLRVYR
jgi:outer membrane protein assembly factor BamB